MPRAMVMDPLEKILMHATEADVGGKGQKDGVGKLEKKQEIT